MSWRSIIILLVVFALASSALILFRSPSKVENKEPTNEENTDVVDPSDDPSDEPTEEFKNTAKTYEEEFTLIEAFDSFSDVKNDNLYFYSVLTNLNEMDDVSDLKKYSYSGSLDGVTKKFTNNHFNVDLKQRTEEVYSFKFNMKFDMGMTDFRIYLKQPGYQDQVQRIEISESYIDFLEKKGMNFASEGYTEFTFEVILDYIDDISYLNIYDVDGKNMLISTESIALYSQSDFIYLPVTLRIEFTNFDVSDNFLHLEFGKCEYSKITVT